MALADRSQDRGLNRWMETLTWVEVKWRSQGQRGLRHKARLGSAMWLGGMHKKRVTQIDGPGRPRSQRHRSGVTYTGVDLAAVQPLLAKRRELTRNVEV